MDKKVGDTIEVSGKISLRKQVNKNGQEAILITLPFEEDKIFSRVMKGTKEYDIINDNVVDGNLVTVKGELTMLKGVDNAKYNWMGVDSIVVEEQDMNRSQIIREDARGAFVEAMMDGFEIDKLRMNFIKYDTTNAKGSRQTANISIYLDIDDADYFCEAILSGMYASKIRASKKKVELGEAKYVEPADEFFGGTSAKVLAKRGQARADGKALARVLTVEASSSKNNMLCLTAQQGPGLEGKNGQIQPERANFEEKVMIPLSYRAAIRFARAIRRAIDAYETSKQVVVRMKEEK